MAGPEHEGENNDLTSEIEKFEPIVVLELFTSQGCSSCPAADALLNQIKQKSGETIFTLSYHVDYWNYIGWEDPFSSSEYAKKQQLYNQKFKYRSNYTPQMVINGKEHFVGSDAAKLYAGIAAYKKVPSMNKVDLAEIKREADHITFNYKVAGDIKNKKVKALLVVDERTTAVKKGENRNRTLVNSNIVVAERTKDLSTGQGTLKVAIPETIRPDDTVRLIVLIETYTYDITGAVKKRINV